MKRMRNSFKVFGSLALTASVCGSLWSCADEAPFKIENDGKSLVRFNLNINQNVTRADEGNLADNCIVYISNENGLIHKWTGLGNIPSEGIYLRYGSYLAEALCGDSVPASFDNKYLKGETRFDVSENQIATQVTINCKLANVVVSLDASALSPQIFNNLKLIVTSSSGNLIYEGQTLNQKGYFMMPYNESLSAFEDNLDYILSGKDVDDTPFEIKGEISDVKPAHEYKVVLRKDETADNVGGANLKIQIREYELEIDETVIIHGKPEFAWSTGELEIENQLYNKDQRFDNNSLLIAAFQDFNRLILSTEDNYIKTALGERASIDILKSSDEEKETLKQLGVYIEDGKNGLYRQFRLTFESAWLNKLEASEKEYVMSLSAEDSRGMTNSMKIRIATSENALDAPFVINTDYWKNNLLSIKAHSAIIPVNLYGDVENLVLRYKKSEDENWVELTPVNSLKTENHEFLLSELDQRTSYDVQLLGGKLIDGKYQFESSIETFETEGVFEIPNAGMENWWLYNNKIWMPNKDAASEFWDTGNHGATAIGDDKDNITTQFFDFYNSGQSCAKLLSKFVGVLTIGKLGSGNIFTGKYAGTSGTNGKIDFGREYNASHPKALRVWVNYRPAKAVNRKGANNNYIKEGELDKGQIYIALSDQIKRVDTSNSSTLVTEERAPELFLAYGQQTFEGDFGEEGKLEMVEIPFTYFEKAKTTASKYLIIVCCASKYGDYFSGGDGSIMYVDDFELIYE